MRWQRLTTPAGDRALDIVEAERPSRLDLALAFGAVAPLVAGAVAAWTTGGSTRDLAMSLAIIWGGAILAFMAGVRRGLSFRTRDGPQGAQLAVTLWIFALAFGSMVALRPLTSLILLIVGYASLLLSAGAAAAAHADASLAFGSVRPVQTAVAVLSLCVVAARLLMGV